MSGQPHQDVPHSGLAWRVRSVMHVTPLPLYSGTYLDVVSRHRLKRTPDRRQALDSCAPGQGSSRTGQGVDHERASLRAYDTSTDTLTLTALPGRIRAYHCTTHYLTLVASGWVSYRRRDEHVPGPSATGSRPGEGRHRQTQQQGDIMPKPGHPESCGPYCAIQHCACGRPAKHGGKTCTVCTPR